jgi:phage-related protein
MEKLTNGLANMKLEVGGALLPVISQLAEVFLPIVQDIAPAFANVITRIVEGLQGMFGFISENLPVIATFIGVLGALVIAFNFQTISTMLLAAAQIKLNAAFFLNPMLLVAVAVAALVAGIVYLATKTTFFQDIWETMTVDISAAWEGFKDLFVSVMEAIGSFFTGIGESLSESWKKTTDFLGGVWETFAGFIGGIWEGFKTGFDRIVNGFRTIFETVFNAIKGFFIGIVNGYIGIFERFINFVIDGVNGLINLLNKLQINIPATPFAEAFTIGLNLPNLNRLAIPRVALAEGGFVDRPTNALIGEAGPEVVTPLADFERMLGLGEDNGKTLIYNAAPNTSLDSEQALFQAMRRAKVVAAW